MLCSAVIASMSVISASVSIMTPPPWLTRCTGTSSACASFVRAQSVSAVPVPDDGRPRRYVFTGLVVCGVRGRRPDGHWVHGRAGYRCRHHLTTGLYRVATYLPTTDAHRDRPGSIPHGVR
jgi:hypothetical protein